MEKSAYLFEAKVEESHWWFIGRRRLLASLIRKLRLSLEAPVLDLGTGTGGNLRLLKQLGFTQVVGLDANEMAIQCCREKGFAEVKKGDICDLPFEDHRFQLVLATDILEHVDDDLRALAEIKRVLRPGGEAVMTVPAFQSLWGIQDELGHHKRRYRIRTLQRRVREAGMECRESFYFNYLLFFPIWLARKLVRLSRAPIKNENQMIHPMLNPLLHSIFTADVLTAPRIKPPFGVSLLIVGRKPA